MQTAAVKPVERFHRRRFLSICGAHPAGCAQVAIGTKPPTFSDYFFLYFSMSWLTPSVLPS